MVDKIESVYASHPEFAPPNPLKYFENNHLMHSFSHLLGWFFLIVLLHFKRKPYEVNHRFLNNQGCGVFVIRLLVMLLALVPAGALLLGAKKIFNEEKHFWFLAIATMIIYSIIPFLWPYATTKLYKCFKCMKLEVAGDLMNYD